jgi:predicted transcriptional regulator
VASTSHPLSLRLGDDGWRALEDIARKRGVTRAEAARQAISETAERERRRSGLAAEVAALADDSEDRAARDRVIADMDAIATDWPE